MFGLRFGRQRGDLCASHTSLGAGGGRNSLNNSSQRSIEQGVSDWIAVPLLSAVLQQRGRQTVRCVSVQATGQWTFIIHESLIRN